MPNTNRTLPKWLSYAGGFCLCFFLERCVLNALFPWHIVPLLTPLAVAAVGFWEGAGDGALFGLLAGLVCAVTCGAGHNRMIWLCSLIGCLCGLTLHRALGRTFPGYLLCAVGSMALVEGVQVLLALSTAPGQWEAIQAIALAEAGCSLLFAPGIYLLFTALYRRFRSNPAFETV